MAASLPALAASGHAPLVRDGPRRCAGGDHRLERGRTGLFWKRASLDRHIGPVVSYFLAANRFPLCAKML